MDKRLNRYKRKFLIFFLVVQLISNIFIIGCTKQANNTGTVMAENVSTATDVTSVEDIEVDYSDEDMEDTWDEGTAVKISLDGDNVKIDGSGVAKQGKYILINKAGTYVFSGTMTAGQILVAAGKEDTVRIVLNGVKISCPDSAVIYSRSSKKTIITLAKDSMNSLEDGKEYVNNKDEKGPLATIFSKSDLTINGTGTLNVVGNFRHGIYTKDDLVITGGNIKVSAVKDGLKGKDSVAIKNGVFVLNVKEDAISADNDKEADKGWVCLDGGKYNIAAGDDAIHAESILKINEGKIDISKCAEGLEGVVVIIKGGDISLKASDDGINAAGGINSVDQNEKYKINISGGKIKLDAAGDGLDSNGSIYISGGEVYVDGPTNNGNGPIDYNYECKVSGGFLAIAGSSGMAQAPGESSTQNSITVYYKTLQKAGTPVILKDTNGKEIFRFTPAKDYQSILISSKDLAKDKTYSLLSGKKILTKIKISDTVTKISDDGTEVTGAMGGPGRQGGPGKDGSGAMADRQPPPDGKKPVN